MDALHDERIIELLMKEDDISWQSILQNLVKEENLDPWDIDISRLAASYIEMLKKMQELNLAVSGKVLLASAILLKLKSNRLLQEDLLRLETMMNGEQEETDEGFGDDGDLDLAKRQEYVRPILLPKTPQPRERKVSIFDLIEALQDALEDKKKRALRQILDEIPVLKAPEKKEDISAIIARLSKQIDRYYQETDLPLKFSDLVPSPTKEDMVMTFIPLLQLCNDRTIDLHQQQHFDEIHILKVQHTAEQLLSLEEEREKVAENEEKKVARDKAKMKAKKADKKKKQTPRDAKASDEALSEQPAPLQIDPIDIKALEETRDSVNTILDETLEQFKPEDDESKFERNL